MRIDVSSVTSHFPNPQDGFITTTSGAVSSGASTVGLNSTGDYSNGDIVALIIDPADSDKKQVFVGTIDTAGVQVTGVVWVGGTNQSHSTGATVVDYYDAAHVHMTTKGLLVSHNQDGTIKNGAVSAAAMLGSNVVTETKLADGAVTPAKWANPYKFRAYRSAALTLTAGAATKMPLDTESYDSNSNFASGTYTVPVSGFYQFNARFSCTTTRVFVMIYKNGSEVARGVDLSYSSSIMGSVVSDCIQCAAGDTIEMYYFSAGAVSLDVGSAQTYLSGRLVSQT